MVIPDPVGRVSAKLTDPCVTVSVSIWGSDVDKKFIVKFGATDDSLTCACSSLFGLDWSVRRSSGRQELLSDTTE